MKMSWTGTAILRYCLFYSLVIYCAAAGASAEEDMLRGSEAYDRQDVVEAIKWFNKAAVAGNAEAQVRLAYIFDKAEENDRAFYWYRTAAEQGNAQGQFGLSQMYATGEGVTRNIDQAASWLKKSAASGYIDAIMLLAVSYEKGELGFGMQYEKAVSLYTQAAEQGDIRAMSRLSRAYAKGEVGLRIDKQQSSYWGEKHRLTVASNKARIIKK